MIQIKYKNCGEDCVHLIVGGEKRESDLLLGSSGGNLQTVAFQQLQELESDPWVL
jgi:hypothetical protein